ncbi:uncharacterized protein LOC132301224 [Cornus florida]|uniref:uncharacterized protein LOC132301224 n=1 Tax=Cornus florida TaxID=4283 RepID=UPI00289CBCD2|nr:uncharacterized protein LOC132301224 [Cornus florida]
MERNLEYLLQFNKLMKLTFEGGPDPLVADDWLDEVEKHFRAITVPGDWLKITLATYKFVSNAVVWWKTMTNAHDIDSMSWDTFKSLFFEKYFPQTKRRELRTRFDSLKQGDMSVTEYKNKFTSLSRFATEVLGNEEEKTWHFVYGLNRSIRPGLTLLGLKNYSEAVMRALMVEAEAKDWREKSGTEQRTASATPIVGVSSELSRTSLVCYHCKQPGHRKAECPLDRPSSGVCFRCAGDTCEFGCDRRYLHTVVLVAGDTCEFGCDRRYLHIVVLVTGATREFGQVPDGTFDRSDGSQWMGLGGVMELVGG